MRCHTRAMLGGPLHRTVAHDVVDFGLAKHLVHRYTQVLLAVAKHRIAYGLARAHDGL